MDKSRFTYAIYISASPETVWNAFIDPQMTARYWQHENVSDWRPGSRWEHRSSEQTDRIDMRGTVIEFSPPRKLVLSWALPEDESHDKKYSRVTLAVEPFAGVVCVTVTHDNLEPGSEMLTGISEGWPKVLSSMKSLLETGRPLPKLW
jgi:uncharacterized protein YndB with AHSA1/START domain